MSPNEDFPQPTTLQEAINIIKFITTSHKKEISRLKETQAKQAAIIKKLETNRKKELEYLSSELLKYETNLNERTEDINRQIAEKDKVIQKQNETIEELNRKLNVKHDFVVPEIIVDSNSDSGVVLESEDTSSKMEDMKVEVKASRKCSRRFADSIGFLRRVDFSPMKYKPGNGGGKKKEEKKNTLEVPTIPVLNKRIFTRQFSNERPLSDDERLVFDDSIFTEGQSDPIVVRSKKLNDSMNNHFSDDGSDDTSEEVFDRVMTRSSTRRSVKANPKYKKINRSKAKLLEQVKVNIID
ncbi:uncharacterized protein LOC128671828 [Plodia interpunctella]|uniref:uncharacterized protein LOC128671828 n=1 Tax=Plodia interpunctella TaxID=58824 RepID=UPI002367DC6B|nr:uncharacterized protein LOC128671828 [Plodia interpunctella]